MSDIPSILEARVIRLIAQSELLKTDKHFLLTWWAGLASGAVAALAAVGVTTPISAFAFSSNTTGASIWEVLSGYGDSAPYFRALYVGLVLVVVARFVASYLGVAERGKAVGDCMKLFRRWLGDLHSILDLDDASARKRLEAMRTSMSEAISKAVEAGFWIGEDDRNTGRIQERVTSLIGQFKRSHPDVFSAPVETRTVQQLPRSAVVDSTTP